MAYNPLASHTQRGARNKTHNFATSIAAWTLALRSSRATPALSDYVNTGGGDYELGQLWRRLLAVDGAVMAAFTDQLSPATLRQLRVAALPGSTDARESLALLRVKQLRYGEGMSEQQLARVVELRAHQSAALAHAELLPALLAVG